MPMTLRSLTLTKEEAAVARVAFAALGERTDVLSPEGREVLRSLIAKSEEVLAKFPAGHPGVITQDEADHRDRMVEALTPKVDPGNGHTHGHSLNLCYIVHEEA